MTLPTLASEIMFYVGTFPVTNTYINSTITVLLFGIFGFFLNLSMKKYYSKESAPKGLLNFFEAVLETIMGYFDQVTGNREKTIKFLPIVGSLFFFILVSNWMAFLPGTGSIGLWQFHNGQMQIVPLLRPANTDLNTTAAMAVLAVTSSHILGIAIIGFFKYINKFIKLGDLYIAVKSLNPVKILVVVIEFFVGFIEIFSEIAKMVSLSLRLYGNIFAGEILLTVIASLIAGYGAFAIPLPFMALELIVGVIQATVFAMLTLVYLNIATQEPLNHAEEAAH